jgi:hypothetical protein
MSQSKTPTWRDEIDALAFELADHQGVWMVHLRAFWTLFRAIPLHQK